MNGNGADVPHIAVIIPCFRARRGVLDVIRGIGPEVSCIFVVDDACPEGTADLVESECTDSRVRVIRHATNRGVGAAVVTGYLAALDAGFDVLVKVDGDGQMDPKLIPGLVAPILSGDADYAKGNRFFDIETIRSMPWVRLAGNAILSFMAKLSTGYWNLFDPTNGFTAIHGDVARRLPLYKLSSGYFFETDILFRLNILRAVVVDVPMDARYGDEVSSLKIGKVLGEFSVRHLTNFFKRVGYCYFLRDASIASIELPLGVALFGFGTIFGAVHWIDAFRLGRTTPAGTVMLSALPVLLGVQLVLAFVGHDVANVPSRVLQNRLDLAADLHERRLNSDGHVPES